MTDAELAAALVAIADALERPDRPLGLLRLAARRLVARAAEEAPSPTPGRCRGCGDPLPPRNGRGRPRSWCPREACQRARKNARKR